MDKLTREQRRRNMQAIKSTGSQIELTLSRALHALGYRYRKNDKTVFGKPDLVFKKYRIAIFVDSEFWHGKNWKKRKSEFKTNKEFWIKKIEGNIKRDKVVNTYLRKNNWIVIRFWGSDIKKKLRICIDEIERKIFEAETRSYGSD